MEKGGIYIHIPYCRNKCLYCDFYTGGVRIADWERYVGSLLNELEQRREEIPGEVATLYIGGGTPSLMPLREMERLVGGLRKYIPLDRVGEFTIEVNPEDVDEEKAAAWKDLGIDRISMGIQSLQDNELCRIKRGHDSATAIKGIEILQRYFVNISVDVMYGLPGQTLDSYKDTLEKILQYSPQHLSAYSLMLEEGTALTHLVDTGKIILPDEDEWIRMFELTNEMLVGSRYLHYEVSNFAKPGFESRHNSSYWEGKPYLGLGAGAHSYDGGFIRRSNPNDIRGYVNYFGGIVNREELAVGNTTGEKKRLYEEEILSEDELREEYIMTGMRLKRGVDLKGLEERFGSEAKKILLDRSSKYKERGLVKEEGNFLSLTKEGLILYNSVVSDLI